MTVDLAGGGAAITARRPLIAVLMTCHDRRELTVRCLGSLAGQALFDPAALFLVDDGSSDGTGDAVRALLPGAQVIAGDGSLFWNGGMRLAWSRAKADGRPFDHYLWLNDDVVLRPDALEALVDDAEQVAGRAGAVIVAAAVCEPAGQAITYGGHRRPDPRRPLRLSLVSPAGKPVPIDSVSGNVVLVSAAAERRLGNLSPVFTHIFGDIDYGLRARAAGIPVVLASRVGGTCAANPASGSADPHASRFARLRARLREDRTVHAADWRRFVRLHGGGRLAALAHRAAPYLRILLGRPNRHATRVLTIADRAGTSS